MGAEAITVEITAANHKAYIMMPLEILYGVEHLGISHCTLSPVFLTCKLLKIPEASGIEARAPVVYGNICDLAVLKGFG